jgi:peptide/nickel transport system permease protein
VGAQRYLIRKVLHALITLLFVLAANFFLFRIMPGDPVALLARSQRISQEEQARQIAALGLDKPLPEQLVIYFRETLQGNLGISVINPKAVTELIGERLWATILLVGTSTIFSTVIGLWIGIRGAWRRGTFFDSSTLYGSLILYSMPEGWFAMIMLITFAGLLGLFPTAHYSTPLSDATGLGHVVDVANHMFLPCLTLTLGYIGEYAIVMRSSLLEVMNEDFVLTARAKGLRDKMVRRRHAVPNALLPTLTLVFYSFGFVLGGAIIIETVFTWPGLGTLTYKAINQRDFPVMQGVFLLFSAAVIVFNLFADILYGYLDPRVREA